MKLLRLLAPLLLAVALHSAPLERDLGEGLVYFRAHHVPADLPGSEATPKRPCVLDLRFAQAEPAGGAIWAAWLKFHAGDKTPLFVLVNGHTAEPLLAPLVERDALPGLLVIGVASPRLEPDIAVVQPAAEERRAYDALENGATVAAVTVDNPNKQRNDEASLSHERPPSSNADDDPPHAEKELGAANARPPPIDAALQRAIQLHRALHAMKKV